MFLNGYGSIERGDTDVRISKLENLTGFENMQGLLLSP